MVTVSLSHDTDVKPERHPVRKKRSWQFRILTWRAYRAGVRWWSGEEKKIIYWTATRHTLKISVQRTLYSVRREIFSIRQSDLSISLYIHAYAPVSDYTRPLCHDDARASIHAFPANSTSAKFVVKRPSLCVARHRGDVTVSFVKRNVALHYVIDVDRVE